MNFRGLVVYMPADWSWARSSFSRRFSNRRARAPPRVEARLSSCALTGRRGVTSAARSARKPYALICDNALSMSARLIATARTTSAVAAPTSRRAMTRMSTEDLLDLDVHDSLDDQ